MLRRFCPLTAKKKMLEFYIGDQGVKINECQERTLYFLLRMRYLESIIERVSEEEEYYDFLKQQIEFTKKHVRIEQPKTTEHMGDGVQTLQECGESSRSITVPESQGVCN